MANEEKKPIRVICPGKVYRRDDDATHSHQFAQVEGLVIDKNISLADLKGTLEVFMKKMLGENTELRFRPSYFPFTEPSYEVDVSCFKCGGKGCSLCKQTGWIEVLGAGIVHPNVLKMNGYDPEQYGGFAFGTGLLPVFIQFFATQLSNQPLFIESTTYLLSDTIFTLHGCFRASKPTITANNSIWLLVVCK